MKYAVVPLEAWRDLFHKRAEAIMSEFLPAGTDPEKITAVYGHIKEYNDIRAQVEVIEK